MSSQERANPDGGAPDCVAFLDLEGRLTGMNPECLAFLGIADFAPVAGRAWSELWPADWHAGACAAVAAAAAGGIGRFRGHWPNASGLPRWWDVVVAPTASAEGQGRQLVAVSHDVTEQKQAEEGERRLLAEAAEANAKFRAFFEQGALFAGIMDMNGVILEPNRLSLEACGYVREQVVGKPFWECPWWTPSPALVEQIKVAFARASGGETYRAEMPYFVADGSERMVDFILLPITDDAGRVVFLAPTGTDVTERHRLENELRRLAADLSEADRRKNEFLAMLAHELRNPLTPIRNAAHVIGLRATDDTVRSMSAMLERQLAHLVRLVDDLLDVSRISRGKIELRSARVDLAAVVEQAVEAASPLFESMRHELVISMPPGPIPLQGDHVRLTQVVGNLLTNACKFTPEGGRVWLSVERDGAQATLRVRDGGIGIGPRELPHVFEMFMQADTTIGRPQAGLGIGLTLVRELVQRHGGSVEVHSEGLGRGTELVVRLPLAAPPDAAEPAPAPAAASAVVPRRILVVDDNRDAVESLSLLLEIDGHTVLAAYDGQEAVASAAAHRPDVVLLDIGLPELNGYEVAQMIRAEPWGAQVLLVALTGWGQDEDRRKSQQAGFDAHLVKPVEYQALAELLARAGGSGRLG